MKKKKYKLTVCSKLSQKKCNSHPYCLVDNKSNDCKLNLETLFWQNLFINRICETLIRNYNERIRILDGSYKPSFYEDDGLILTDDEIFLTNENFNLIKQIYKSSKYHHDIDIFENVESNKVKDRVIKVPYSPIIEKPEDLSDAGESQSQTGSINDIELTGLTGINKKKLKNVYATVFDKDGKYRSQYTAGPCIFPYIYGNTKQLFFDCNKDKDEGQRCPVEVDKNKRALKWGFCPAEPRMTRENKNILEIKAKATNDKGKIDKGFKSGKCIFPFRYHPSYDLSWECINTKQGNTQKWCATSLKSGRNISAELPVAADKEDKIYQKKWDWKAMYDEKNKFNDDFLRYSTRGYCPSTEKQKDKQNIESNLEGNELTIENFNMNKCNQSDSKGGYSKNILKQFAINQLNFTEEQFEGKKKEALCQMIGERLTNLRTKTDLKGKTLLDIYKKDPKSCNKGESGGGYYLGILRKMASRYFGMDPENAKDATKEYLCDFIIPILDKEALKINKNKPVENLPLSSIYTKNPNYCEDGPRKGGYTFKDLKEMGVKYFGIDENLNKKDEICKIIVDKLNQEKMNKIETDIAVSSYGSDYEDSDEQSFTFFDELKSNSKSLKKRKYKKLNSSSKTSHKK